MSGVPKFNLIIMIPDSNNYNFWWYSEKSYFDHLQIMTVTILIPVHVLRIKYGNRHHHYALWCICVQLCILVDSTNFFVESTKYSICQKDWVEATKSLVGPILFIQINRFLSVTSRTIFFSSCTNNYRTNHRYRLLYRELLVLIIVRIHKTNIR